jgi:hypothetical protein
VEWPVLPHPHIRFLFCLQLFLPFRRWPTSPQSPFPYSRNPLEVMTTWFAIFPLKISYGFLLGIPLLSRCDRCPALHPSMSFIAVFFLRHSGSLTPRSFICFVPRSCCLSPWPLISILHSCLFHSLILDVHHFWVLCPTLSWSYSL